MEKETVIYELKQLIAFLGAQAKHAFQNLRSELLSDLHIDLKNQVEKKLSEITDAPETVAEIPGTGSEQNTEETTAEVVSTSKDSETTSEKTNDAKPPAADGISQLEAFSVNDEKKEAQKILDFLNEELKGLEGTGTSFDSIKKFLTTQVQEISANIEKMGESK